MTWDDSNWHWQWHWRRFRFIEPSSLSCNFEWNSFLYIHSPLLGLGGTGTFTFVNGVYYRAPYFSVYLYNVSIRLSSITTSTIERLFRKWMRIRMGGESSQSDYKWVKLQASIRLEGVLTRIITKVHAAYHRLRVRGWT
jgi:hypothetical protein